MQRRGSTWYCLGALLMLVSFLPDVVTGAEQKDVNEPLPAEAVKACVSAVAAVGWMRMAATEPPKFQTDEKMRPRLCRCFNSRSGKRDCWQRCPILEPRSA